MTDSILLTVKKMLGIAEEYHAFDLDIIININSVFLTLNQIGVGPEKPYQIIDDSQTWADFVDPSEVPGIQTYVYLKVRLLFDPPTNSFLVESIKQQIAELEFRLNIQVDTKYPDDEEEPSKPDIPIEPTEPDDEWIELTPEEVREIYNAISTGRMITEMFSEGNSTEDMIELTPDEVKAIYEAAVPRSSDQEAVTMSVSLDEPVRKKSIKSVKEKLARIKRRR